MRFIVGIIVGAALILGASYLHDTGKVHFGPQGAFVNWSTVFAMIGR
jgi:hypothetical protein